MAWLMMSGRDFHRIGVLAQVDDGRPGVQNDANLLDGTKRQMVRLLKTYRTGGVSRSAPKVSPCLHGPDPRAPDRPCRDHREQALQRRAGPYQGGAGQGRTKARQVKPVSAKNGDVKIGRTPGRPSKLKM